MVERLSHSQSSSPTGERRRDALIIISLMVIATIIRVRGLTAANLWLDEANSWQVASDSWGGLLTNVLRSPVGPLYFVLLKVWIAVFGDSVGALRALSLVASIALIPVVYAIGARLLSRQAALLACGLVAISPLELYFAQEVRMYMLVSLLGAACVLAYARWRDAIVGTAQEEAGSPAWALLGYVGAGIALLFTHLVAGVLLVAINADAALVLWRTRERTRDRLAWVGANIVIALVVLSYLSSISAGSALSSQAWRTSLGIEGSVRAALLLPFAAIHGEHYYPADFWTAMSAAMNGHGIDRRFFELLVVQPLVLIVFVAALVAGRRATPHAGGRRLLALAAFLPMLAVTIVSVTRGLEFPRYLLFVVPFLFLLVADGLLAIRPSARAASLAVLALAMILGTRTERGMISRDSDYRSTAALLGREGRVGDRILIQPREMNAPLRYYLRSDRLPVIGVAADGSVAEEARALAPHRTWVILDYRSPLYSLAPDELEKALDAPLERDVYTSDASAGVRVAVLRAP